MKTKFIAIFLLVALLMTGCDDRNNEGQDVATSQNPITVNGSTDPTTDEQSDTENGSDEQTMGEQNEKPNATNDSTEPTMGEQPSTTNGTTPSTDNINNGTEQPTNVSSVSAELSSLNLQGVSGKVSQIANGLDGNIIVLADKMYLYSSSDNSVKASTDYTKSNDMKFLPLDDGYALVAYGSSGYSCYLYDDSLNLTNTVFVGEEILSAGVITVSHDGNKIAYSGAFETTIMLIDVQTEQTSQMIDLASTNTGVLAIDYLMFSANDAVLGFKGQSENPTAGEQSLPIYGSVNIDGSNPNSYLSNDFAIGDIALMSGNTLLLLEDPRVLTGRIKLFDTSTGKSNTINLTSSDETDGKAYISDSGNYFATGELKNNNSLIVRIYSKDGTLLNTATMDSESADYFYRGSTVVICEESRTATISLGNWNTEVATNMYIIGF